MTTDTEALVRRAYHLSEGDVLDVQGFIDLFAEDGVFNGIGGVSGQESYRGQHLGDVVVFMGKFLPDVHRELHRVNVLGNVVAIELSIRGTFLGPFETPAGVIQPTGAKLDIPTADFWYVRDGKIAPLGLRLAPEKTRVIHIDEGLDFLGFHIRRQRKRGTQKYYVYTKPSRKAIQAIKDKVKARTYRSTRHMALDELITSLNRLLAGWANYFRYGVSKAVFGAIDSLAWGRIMRWIRAKHKRGRNPIGMTELRRRFCDKGWRFAWSGVAYTGASSVAVKRYRYRGNQIPSPWTPKPAATATSGG